MTDYLNTYMSDDKSSSSFFIDDSEMSQVAKGFLFDGMNLPASVYVRISKNNYLLIGKKNDPAQLKSYKSFANDDFQIFVLGKERFLLIAFISNLTAKTIANPAVSFQQNQQFISGLIDASFEELSAAPLGNLTALKGVSKLILQLSKQPGVFQKAFELLALQDQSDSKHALLTCLVSLILAEQTCMLNNLSEEKLALGALLHDYGLKTVPEAIRKKSRAERTPEETKIYEAHPTMGAEMLRSLPGMSVEVILIVAEHEETSKGTGYPKGLRDVRINPLAKIVSLAALFCELTFPRSGAAFNPDEAISYIENVLGQPYNKSIFTALCSVVKTQFISKKAA